MYEAEFYVTAGKERVSIDSECDKETAGCQNCRFAIKVH